MATLRQLLILLLFATEMSGQWEYVGQKSISTHLGNYKGIAVNPSTNEPYIIFQDNVRSGRATVMRFDGTEWTLVGPQGFNEGGVYSNDIAFQPDGTPWTVLWDGGHAGKTTVMRYSEERWSYTGPTPSISEGQASWQSIDVDANGVPYIAFRDAVNNYGASVLRFNGSNWDYLGGKGFTDPVQKHAGVSNISLTLDRQGRPYIAYQDFSNDFVTTVQRFRDGKWEVVGTPGFAGWCSHFTRSMAFDSQNRPHIIVKTEGGLCVMRFEDDQWSCVGGPVAPTSGEYATIEIGPRDQIFIAYQDYRVARRLSAAVYDGKEWHDHKQITEGSVWHIHMDVDRKGNVYVAFSEKVNDVWTVSVMKCSEYAVEDVSDSPSDTIGEIRIFPNPCKGSFRVSGGQGRVLVTDMLGRGVIDAEFTDEGTFDINEKGIYVATVDCGDQIKAEKIIVE